MSVPGVLRRLFGVFFIAGGLMHFVRTPWYVLVMPPYLPAHRKLVYASGIAEVVGGAATMNPRTSRAGSILSIATLIAIYPANVHMALHPERFADHIPGGQAALYARLPFQALLIAWAWFAGEWDRTERERHVAARKPAH